MIRVLCLAMRVCDVLFLIFKLNTGNAVFISAYQDILINSSFFK